MSQSVADAIWWRFDGEHGWLDLGAVLRAWMARRVHNVGDAITNIDGRVTQNTTNIAEQYDGDQQHHQPDQQR